MYKRFKKLFGYNPEKDTPITIDTCSDDLSTEEVMEVLQIDTNKVYELLNSGDIKCPRLHQKFIIPKLAVKHYMLKSKNGDFSISEYGSNMFQEFPNYLTLYEVAEALDICYESARYLVSSGRLLKVNKGRKFLVPKYELIYFLTHP